MEFQMSNDTPDFPISYQVWLESGDDNWEMDGIVVTCAGRVSLEILSSNLISISADSPDSLQNNF